MLIKNTIYQDGVRSEDPVNLEDTFEMVRDHKAMAWIGLYRPDEDEVRSIAHEFELHELAIEDAVAAHQRPKCERYGSTLFTVLRPARYLDETEEVEFGELLRGCLYLKCFARSAVQAPLNALQVLS